MILQGNFRRGFVINMDKDKKERRKEMKRIMRVEIRKALVEEMDDYILSKHFREVLGKAMKGSEWLAHYIDLLKTKQNKGLLIDSLVENNDFIQPFRRMMSNELKRKLKNFAVQI